MTKRDQKKALKSPEGNKKSKETKWEKMGPKMGPKQKGTKSPIFELTKDEYFTFKI